MDQPITMDVQTFGMWTLGSIIFGVMISVVCFVAAIKNDVPRKGPSEVSK